jgi:hypothetical protein
MTRPLSNKRQAPARSAVTEIAAASRTVIKKHQNEQQQSSSSDVVGDWQHPQFCFAVSEFDLPNSKPGREINNKQSWTKNRQDVVTRAWDAYSTPTVQSVNQARAALAVITEQCQCRTRLMNAVRQQALGKLKAADPSHLGKMLRKNSTLSNSSLQLRLMFGLSGNIFGRH